VEAQKLSLMRLIYYDVSLYVPASRSDNPITQI
jgi:hypothetical protein